MGQILNLSSQSPSLNKAFSRLTIVDEASFYHFGKVQILQDQANGGKFFKQKFDFILQPQQQQHYIKKLKQHNNQCPYIIQIKHIQSKKMQLCSPMNINNGNINVYFEYIPMTLSEIIKRRKSSFSQSQVWRILNSLFSAIKYMNENQSYHGDLCPQFVYFDNRNLKYKIFDSSYFTPLKNGYYRAQLQKIYCSPQILSNLSQKRTFPLYNHHIADTFSIGLILLYCMTLIDPLTAYDHQKSQINYYFIENMLRVAYKNKYSDKLLNLVGKSIQLKNRPTAQDILKEVQIQAQQLGQVQQQTLYIYGNGNENDLQKNLNLNQNQPNLNSNQAYNKQNSNYHSNKVRHQNINNSPQSQYYGHLKRTDTQSILNNQSRHTNILNIKGSKLSLRKQEVFTYGFPNSNTNQINTTSRFN